MGMLFDNLAAGKLDRRAFVGAGALAAASAALAGLSTAQSAENELGLAPEQAFAEEGMPTATVKDVEVTSGRGEWRSAACWFNCGGKCVNKCYVEDGIVIRQKTDDTHDDSFDYPQMRGCLKGRSLRTTVFGEDRVKYPMKRKNWQPGGGENSHGELRGADEWERLSWDEALDLVADELMRIKVEHGNESILCPSWGGVYLSMSRIYEALYELGGYSNVHDTASFGAWASTSAPVGLNFCNIIPSPEQAGMNDRLDMLKADAIVLHGCNPAWATMGVPVWNLMRAKEAGIPFVTISPDYNASGDLYDAKWIQVRPGTDIAFLLGVAYSMLEQDAEKGLIDWDFLHTCCIGFDEESMPEGAPADQNFRAYLEGAIDGQPKTPEWASEICGAAVEDIEWYAELLGKQNNLWIMTACASARCNNADDFPQLFMTVGAMGAHMGREGNATGVSFASWATNSGPYLVTYGDTKDKYNDSQLSTKYLASSMWQDILDHKMHVAGTDEVIDVYPGAYIQCWRNALQTTPGMAKGLEAIKEFDFVLSVGSWPDFTMRNADIVLPITTIWERQSMYFYQTHRNREFQVFPQQICEPLYEARSDRDIAAGLLERWGMDVEAALPMSDEQAYWNFIATTQVVDDDGQTLVPLVTITQEDVDEWAEKYGIVGEPQEGGKIGFKELLAQGVYQVERHEGDNYHFISYEEFVNDPEGHPLDKSVSGKFEIYSVGKQQTVEKFGLGTVQPYPTYVPALNGYEQGKDSEYPFQIINPHYPKRAHTPYDNVPVLREAFVNPVFVNTSDAEAKGIADGDVVRVYNQHGSVLRQACVTGRVMPGVVCLPHGGWTEFNAEGHDMGGGDNLLTAPEHTGAGIAAYNTNLVNFEKYEGDGFVADVDRPLYDFGA